MTKIFQYFELYSSKELINFIVKDILFSIIISAVVVEVYHRIQNLRRANNIVKFLLRDNISTRNMAKGKHLADRLLDIYDYGRKPTPLVSRDIIYKRSNFWESCWNKNVIDEILQAKGLVEIFWEKEVQKVRLAESRLTKTVIKCLAKLESQNKI